MTDWVEVVAGERINRYQRAGLIFRTIGWISISWAALVSIWIWMGYRAGLDLWLWCTIGFFVAGLICIGIGTNLQTKAARLVDRTKAERSGDDRIRAA